MLEHRIRAMQQSEEKEAFVEQVVILSKESGVLSDHTSFIGASEARYQCNSSLRDSSDSDGERIVPENDVYDGFRDIGMGAVVHFYRQIFAGDGARPQREDVDIRDILKEQNQQTGAWSTKICGIVSSCFDCCPPLQYIVKLEGLSRNQEQAVLSTIYAISLLRGYFGKLAPHFRTAERKGFAYLRSISSSTNWEQVIQDLTPLGEKL